MIELKQQLRLTQQLIMTPQLQQSIKLLQLSRLELVNAIAQEMQENPVLEEKASEEEAEEREKVQEVDEIKNVAATKEVTGEGDGKEDFDWNSYFDDYGPLGVTYYREETENPSWENMLTSANTLSEYLTWQLHLSDFSAEEMPAAEQIIGNLDVNGYLVATLDEMAEAEHVSPEMMERVLAKVQALDPPGIAARDLKECLLIQIRYLGIDNALVTEIVQDHLKDLETRNYQKIVKKQGSTIDDIIKAVRLISTLDPRPGLQYSDERPQYVVPDVFVYKIGDEYKIVLNDDGLPKLKISNFYKEIMSGVVDSESASSCKDYIREKLQSATWLIKSIQQRQRTIYRVSESIVRHQRDFFERGINYLKPMVLRDIADDVEMHESTISRVTTNKYMHTPRGIYELKYFFNSGINRTDGSSIASESVKEKIRGIIVEENPQKPYNDSQIVDILKNYGISIARRTVAKYRETMGILPSSKRKNLF